MYLHVKRTLRLLALLGCLVAIAALPAAYAQDSTTSGSATQDQNASSLKADEAENVQPLWFVELKSPPAADGTSLSTLKAEKSAFRDAAKKAGIKYKERFAFDTLWNGLSVKVDDPSQVAKLGHLSGVNNLYPVATVSLPEETVSNPDLATALAMTGADATQSELGYTGEGVKVAIIDSGIDYDHPDLGGGFGPGYRVTKGYDFVGDDFTGPGSTPVPDSDPDDCGDGTQVPGTEIGGHGTHVAGIVGANGDVNNGGTKGVAPGVTFGAYKVFGCEGSTTSDVMIAAMERVLADGMKVLNISIGRSFQWPQYPTAQASDRLVNKGVSVVASIGNSGGDGLYAAGAPGVGDKTIGVASFDNTHINLATFTISPDDTAISYSPAPESPPPPTSGSMPMARTGTATSTADACAALPAGSLTGQVALIRRGGCTFYQKALNAQNAGAEGVVLYNNVEGRFTLTVAGSPAITIPLVAISDTEGGLINDRLAAGPVTMTWTEQTASFPNATGGLISSFSSYGLTPDLKLKPDIGAPGGFIRSTLPLEQGGYATFSGTSMSSPHVAGAVALLLEAKPNTSPQAVRDILQNSADPAPWSGDPSSGTLDNVHRQGAGMLDIDDAILSDTIIKPGKLSLGESEAGPATKTLTISNTGASGVTYDLSHEPALSTGDNMFSPTFSSNAPASVAFGSPSVIVAAGGTATVDLTITANPQLADRSQYGGYIVLTPRSGGQGQTYRVPYAGFKGDYQSIQALTPTPRNFPWLAKKLSDGYFRQLDDATFTFKDGDIPYILLHLDHQARRVRMEVKDATSGKSWGRALDVSYADRNSTASAFFSLGWDGVTFNGKQLTTVPNGKYTITLSVQKALGESNNAAHWESWTSPRFNIARP
jgi:subtilisin family serine protease